MLLLLCPAAQPQEYRATITGTVTDPSGAVVPKAHLTITNLGTRFVTPAGINAPVGSSQGLSTLLGQGFSAGDPAREIPRIYQFSVGVEYQLPGQMVADVSYVGNRGRGLEVGNYINSLPASYLSQGTALTTKVTNPMYGFLPATSGLEQPTLPQEDLLVPYPEFGNIFESNAPFGASSYNSLQATLTKRMTHGLALNASFTCAKVMDDTAHLNSSDPLADVARYQDSQPNIVFNFTPTWDLPFFAHSSGLVHEILGGWQTNAIFLWEAGSLIGNPGGAFSTGVSPVLPSGQQTLSHWFNTCTITLSGALQNCPAGATAADAAWTQQPSFTLNELSPTMPGVRTHVPPNVNFSLFKRFTLYERLNAEIRAEFYNLTNTPAFGGPSTSLNSSQFGLISPSQINDPRIIQLALKLRF